MSPKLSYDRLVEKVRELEQQARKLLQRGCRGFIQKPFSLNQLSRKVNEMLWQAENKGRK